MWLFQAGQARPESQKAMLFTKKARPGAASRLQKGHGCAPISGERRPQIPTAAPSSLEAGRRWRCPSLEVLLHPRHFAADAEHDEEQEAGRRLPFGLRPDLLEVLRPEADVPNVTMPHTQEGRYPFNGGG